MAGITITLRIIGETPLSRMVFGEESEFKEMTVELTGERDLITVLLSAIPRSAVKSRIQKSVDRMRVKIKDVVVRGDLVEVDDKLRLVEQSINGNRIEIVDVRFV